LPEKQNLSSGDPIETVGRYHDSEMQTGNVSYRGMRVTTDPRMEKIEIPGASSKCQIVPRLVQFDEGSHVSKEVEAWVQKEECSTVVEKKIVKKKSSDTLINNARSSRGVGMTEIVKSNIEDATLDGSTLRRKAELLHFEENNTETGCFENNKVTHPPMSDRHFNRYSNENATEKIEQLRHAVHRVVIKNSSSETMDNTATREDYEQRYRGTEQIQSQPIKQTVVLKQSLQHVKSPRAFWERSHLSRFNLRLLR
jgi:hypothetical protein